MAMKRTGSSAGLIVRSLGLALFPTVAIREDPLAILGIECDPAALDLKDEDSSGTDKDKVRLSPSLALVASESHGMENGP
jgi:hypothetical protein